MRCWRQSTAVLPRRPAASSYLIFTLRKTLNKSPTPATILANACKARIVSPGLPHHVTQRGVSRQNIFFTHRDRQVYLGLLAGQSRLVEDPSAWRWSSASAHLSVRDPSRTLDLDFWLHHGAADSWRQLLEQPTVPEHSHNLRRATYACRPCGDPSFHSPLIHPLTNTA